MEVLPSNKTVTSRFNSDITPEIELDRYNKPRDAFRGLKLLVYFVQLLILLIVLYKINNNMITNHYLWKNFLSSWRNSPIFGIIFGGACVISITSLFHFILFYMTGGQKKSIYFIVSLASFMISSLIVLGYIFYFIAFLFALLFGGPIH